MWTKVVVFFPEGIELALLYCEPVGRGPCCFRLELTVHAFVPAILFWVSRIGVYGLDTDLKEPDCEMRKPGDGAGIAERRPIVRVHLQREAMFVEYVLENGPRMGIIGELKAFGRYVPGAMGQSRISISVDSFPGICNCWLSG